MSGTSASIPLGGSLSPSVVDSSIPLQAGRGVPQQNPLSTIGDFARTAGAINQIQLQKQQIQSGASSLAQQQLRAAAGSLIPLLAKKDGTITVGDVGTALGSAEANLGIVTQPFVAHLMANAPDPTSPAYDQFIRNTVASLSQPNTTEAVAQVTKGAGPTYQQGSTLLPTTVNPAGLGNAGVITPVPGAGVPVGLTPAERASQVTRQATAADVQRDPTLTIGQMITEPLQTRLQQQGAGNLVTPGINPIAPPGLPASLRNPARQPGSGPIAPMQTPTQPQSAPQPSSDGVVTGMSPAQTSAQTQTGATSANAFQSIAEQGVAARSQDSILANMQADAGQFVTGPGADAIKQFKSVVVRFGDALGTSFGIDKDKLAANVSFDKFANQIADAQGAGSDARLAVNQAANPSSHLTPEGVDLVIRQLRGNTDYLRARASLAAAYPDKANREGFEATVGAHLDPRVFQYMRLKPEQRTPYYKSLTDKAAFQAAYKWAEDNSLIGSPDVAR